MKKHIIYFLFTSFFFGLISYLFDMQQSIPKTVIRAIIFGLIMTVFNYYTTSKDKSTNQ